MTDLKALALYTNEAEDNDELSFKINDLLLVIQENWQDGWHLCQVSPSIYFILYKWNIVFLLKSHSVNSDPQ